MNIIIVVVVAESDHEDTRARSIHILHEYIGSQLPS